MKIFVSYARVDKPYCIRIIETLHAHDVWYDQRLYAGQDWWKEILRRLEWCDVFIYLLSPDSVTSLHCRRELEIALRLKRDIIPVLISGETILPAKMKDWQYVDLADSLTVENISQLLNAILLVERQRSATTTPSNGSGAPVSSPAPALDPAAVFGDAVNALEKGNYEDAIALLKQVRASGYQSRFVPLEKLLRVAESALAERTKSREIEREYQQIVALFKFESMRQMACEALADFEKEFGDYDPQNLRRFCSSSAIADPKPAGSSTSLRATNHSTPPKRPTAQARSTRRASAVQAQNQSAQAAPTSARPRINATDAPRQVNDLLPMLQWCDIPHGTVTIASVVGADEDFGETTEQVDNFVMSKYPVTNAQFDIFVKAQDGYRSPRWWTFSEHAKRWSKTGEGLAKSLFKGEMQPRENVNWYEAMAFANWLSNMLKMKITLPTVAQWQRAAKGEDDRYYPWGDDYHEEHCNTLETGLKTTTPVSRYHKGLSPYGVYDMAGNIWEWTLNTALAEGGRDLRRAVVGGSYVSSCDRAQTSFRYYLDPHVRYSSIGIRLVGLT